MISAAVPHDLVQNSLPNECLPFDEVHAQHMGEANHKGTMICLQSLPL